MFSVYDENAIMKEFDRVSNQPIENDMGGIVYGPNAVLESADEPIMESDDGTVVIKFANGCSVTLNKAEDGYVIGGSEGSSILSKLSGHLVNVELNNIQEGQPLRMSIKINNKFRGWHSGQPVSSVTNGEASNADSQPNVEPKQEQPAADPNQEKKATEQKAEPKPEQKSEGAPAAAQQ